MDQIGIYAIKNIVTGKFYIGKSTEIKSRWVTHFRDLRNGIHHSRYLQRSFNKYGNKYFIKGIIEICSREELDYKERYWIDYYNSFDDGYNCSLPDGKGGTEKNNLGKTIKLYNAVSLILEEEFKSLRECAEFLKCSKKRLNKTINRLRKEKGRTYRGYIPVKEDETLEEILQLYADREKAFKTAVEEKKAITKINADKRYKAARKSPEERLAAQKINSAKSVEKMRREGTHKIIVSRGGDFISEYLLASDAAEDLEISAKGIYKVLSGYRNSYYGYEFKKILR